VALLGVAGSVLAGAGRQGVGQSPSSFPLSNPIRERGSSLTGAYEGWYRDKDGSVRLLVGYFNRNTKQELDIPIGPNNRIEPGGPDQGQPTHFLTARQWGVFSIKVPNDFGSRKLTWTIVANGFTNAITMHTRPEWLVEPFEDAAQKNRPPILKFQPNGPAFTGPPAAIAASYGAVVDAPLTLTTWVTEEGSRINNQEPPATGSGGRGTVGAAGPGRALLSVVWSLFRGPASVTFSPARPSIEPDTGGKATTSATFSVPGEYVLRAQANDRSGDGGGGFQCCWTNAHLAVTVKAADQLKK
jgi:hypothetical protein